MAVHVSVSEVSDVLLPPVSLGEPEHLPAPVEQSLAELPLVQDPRALLRELTTACREHPVEETREKGYCSTTKM